MENDKTSQNNSDKIQAILNQAILRGSGFG